MYSRAESYRRRGFDAQRRAAQTTAEKIGDAFEDIARVWFVLAEHVDWLDRYYKDRHADKSP